MAENHGKLTIEELNDCVRERLIALFNRNDAKFVIVMWKDDDSEPQYIVASNERDYMELVARLEDVAEVL
jgi:hypothetical protein